MIPIRIISLGYERAFLDADSDASRRLERASTNAHRTTSILLSSGKQARREFPNGRAYSFSGNAVVRLWKAFWTAVREVKQARAEGESPVLSAQDPFIAGVIAFKVSRWANVPYEAQEHADAFSGPWERESFLHAVFIRIGSFTLRRADRVRVVSDRIKDRLMHRFGIEASKIYVKQVDQDLSWHLEQEPRAWPSVPTIVAPCRFVPQKGLDVLMSAVSDLRERGLAFRLRLIGSGPLQGELRSRIASLGLDDYVEILPWVSQEELWSGVDLFVLSSNYEGWGRTIVEAMAKRVPIVTTDVGCVGSFFRPQIDGRAVPIGNARALADAIAEQFTERERREWMVAQAHERAKTFSSLQVEGSYLQQEHWEKMASYKLQATSYSFWKWTALLIAGAVLLRALSLYLFAGSLGANREWGFFTLVQNWFLGNGYSFVSDIGCASAYRSPGFLFFLTAVYGVFGFANFFAQAVIQNILAVLVVYFVYRLGWAITKDRRIGLVAGALVALHPYTFYHYTQYYHTVISSLFLVLFMLALLRLEETKKMMWAFWSGVMIALLAYMQGTILPATVFLSLWLLIRWRKEWKRAIGAIAIMAVVSAGLIAPWTIRNWRVFHAFIPLTTDLGHALAKANNDHAYAMNALGYPQEAFDEVHDPANPLKTIYVPLPEVEADFRAHGMEIPDGFFFNREHPLEPGLRRTCESQREFNEVAFNTYWTGLAKEWITTHYWTDGLRLQVQKMVQFWNPQLQPVKRYGAQWSFGTESLVAKLAQWSLTAWVLLVELFTIIGLFVAGKKKILGRIMPFLIIFGVYTFMHSFFAGYTKYRIPLDGLMAILASFAVVFLRDRIRTRIMKRGAQKTESV